MKTYWRLLVIHTGREQICCGLNTFNSYSKPKQFAAHSPMRAWTSFIGTQHSGSCLTRWSWILFLKDAELYFKTGCATNKKYKLYLVVLKARNKKTTKET
jgi:hypothetical protein